MFLCQPTPAREADTIGTCAVQHRRPAKYSKMNALSTKAEASPAGREASSGRPAVRRIEVDEDEGGGQRLDNFLIRHCKGVPKSHLYQLIRSGQVRVNGKRCRPDDRLSAGDLVRVPPVVTAQPARPAGGAGPAPTGAGAFGPRGVPPAQFTILYEDDAILAIDKPAGVAVHGGSGVAHGAIERLRAARPQAKFIELAHRLDRETSGVLLFGKKRAALLALHSQLRERQADKRYLAIVAGRWPLRTKTVQHPLHRYLTPEGERRVRVQADGQAALTRVTGLEQFEVPGAGVFTLVEAKIETGRTHQIRVHLAHAGFPIAGDEKYGDFNLNKTLYKLSYKRMFLHAISMKLRHPSDGRWIVVEAPMPDEFSTLIAAGRPLRRAGPGSAAPDRGDEASR
jgi:23S rRNA pseudouridine955/2504/2580 synthase